MTIQTSRPYRILSDGFGAAAVVVVIGLLCDRLGFAAYAEIGAWVFVPIWLRGVWALFWVPNVPDSIPYWPARRKAAIYAVAGVLLIALLLIIANAFPNRVLELTADSVAVAGAYVASLVFRRRP
jgi:hypothetical protein